MANQPKTKASTYRFTDDDLSYMDLLAASLAGEMGLSIARTDAIRFAVRAECRRRGLAPEKPAQKKSKNSS